MTTKVAPSTLINSGHRSELIRYSRDFDHPLNARNGRNRMNSGSTAGGGGGTVSARAMRGLARGPWLALRRSAGERGRIPAGAVWTVSELRTERDAQDGNVARPGAQLATQPASRFSPCEP